GVGGSHDSTLVKIIKSTGSGFLHIDSMKIAGASGAFILDSGNVSHVILDSGKTLTVRVAFSPVKPGAVQDTLIVYNNSIDTGRILLVGNGTKGSLVLTTNQVAFGDVIVNSPLDSLLAPLLRNTGNAPENV